MLLIFWLTQVKKYTGFTHIGIGLSWKQLLLLLLSEFLLFSVLYFLYFLSIDSTVANSFAWQNLFLYARGVLPILAIAAIDDKTFHFVNNPTWECLIVVLIIDYIVLSIATKFWNNHKVRQVDQKAA